MSLLRGGKIVRVSAVNRQKQICCKYVSQKLIKVIEVGSY